MLRNLISVLVLVLSLTTRTSAQCPAWVWGGLGGGATSGQGYTSTFAVAGMGSRVQSLSTPTTGGASLYASYDIGKEIKKIRAIGGGTAWASDGTSLWAFTSLNAASNPLRFQSTFSPAGGIRDFIPVGLTIYSWTGTTVSVIDYTNAAAPALISTIVLPNTPSEASFLGNRLYLLSSGRTVQIIDVTDPANPAFIRALSLGGNNTVTNFAPFAFSGGGTLVRFAFYTTGITIGSNNLRVVDINADLLAGTSGTVAVTGSIVQISGNFLLQSSSLASINWANPLAPVLTTIYSDSLSRFRSFGTVTSAGVTRAYIAGSEGGFSIVNTNTGALQGRYQMHPGAAYETAFQPGTGNLFTADGLNGLRANQATDGGLLSRTFTQLGGSGGTTANYTRVACTETFALTSNTTQVQKFTIASPGSPIPQGIYAPVTPIYGIAASGISGLVLHNLSGPVALDLLNCSGSGASLAFQSSQTYSADFPNAARRVRAFGDLAVVVNALDARLFTFNRNSPSILSARGVIVAGVNLQDAAVTGNFLYLLDLDGHIRIYNITNLDAPAFITSIVCPVNRTAMSLSGDWIGMVGFGAPQIDFFNIVNRSNPIFLALGNLPTAGSDVATMPGPSGPQFAVAAGACGIRVVGAPYEWVPVITDQPDNTSACPGGTAMFNLSALVSAFVLTPTTYQWNRVGTGGGPIAGATTPTLTIPNVSATDAAFTYTCTLSNACGNVTTAAASLALCKVDINCSGSVTVQDIFDYLALFFAENPAADFNGQAGLTVQDLFDFLAAYFAGCA